MRAVGGDSEHAGHRATGPGWPGAAAHAGLFEGKLTTTFANDGAAYRPAAR